MSTNAAIVHESEVQRQHVRLQLPIGVVIGDVKREADDWSSSGLALSFDGELEKTLGATLSVGQIVESQLYFVFEGFELSMPMRLEIRYIERAKKRMGCRFTNISERQLSLLHYVVSAYVAGELVRAGDLISIAGRNSQLQSRKVPSSTEGLTPAQLMKMKMHKMMLSSLVGVASFAALAYVALGVYERSYVVSASSAEVKADASAVMASAGGHVFFQPNLLDAKVKKGQPLAMIQTEKGNMVSVDSPCDCIVKDTLVGNQEMVATGKPLVSLTSLTSVPYVEARVSADDAVRLATGHVAMLNFTGNGRSIKGKITRIKVSESGAQALVTIAPVEALPVSWVDDPVSVRFDTLLFSK